MYLWEQTSALSPKVGQNGFLGPTWESHQLEDRFLLCKTFGPPMRKLQCLKQITLTGIAQLKISFYSLTGSVCGRDIYHVWKLRWFNYFQKLKGSLRKYTFTYFQQISVSIPNPNSRSYLAVGAVVSPIPPTNWGLVQYGTLIGRFARALSIDAAFPWTTKNQVTWWTSQTDKWRKIN